MSVLFGVDVLLQADSVSWKNHRIGMITNEAATTKSMAPSRLELQKAGFSVDRRDIHLEEPIKVLGQHKAAIKYGEGLEASIMISVERT